ncbi:MAG TPA: hypothetical protein VMZ29_05820 [Candidatus Bathyarchaeia archaeon]|nr:hypothetical protein [Candidatus Bathyarchaeia archaeon]
MLIVFSLIIVYQLLTRFFVKLIKIAAKKNRSNAPTSDPRAIISILLIDPTSVKYHIINVTKKKFGPMQKI